MATPAEQPRFDQPVVDARGFATQAWMNYWLRLASSLSQDELATVVAELQRRVDELESGQSLDFQILGQGSVSVNGVPQPGNVVVISLQGDAALPGNTQYYGTGPTGAKGWFPVSGAITVAAGELTKAVGVDGVTNFGLADLANSGVGAALVKITRDAKGRVSGTQSATTDDLPAGSTNKYFPEAPTDGQQYARQSGAWTVVTASGGGFVPYNIPDGQSFLVPLNQQALFTLPINLGDGSSIVLDGALVEVS
jgi:hypothetical protein